MNAKELTKAISSFHDKEHGKGATRAEVAKAQEVLSVSFPHSYRSYLEHIGWGRFSHIELYGLGQDVPHHLDLIRNTIAERTEMKPLLPNHLIPVLNDGAGNHYCLDTSAFSGAECPVVFWDHEQTDEQDPEIVSPAFADWLMHLLATTPHR